MRMLQVENYTVCWAGVGQPTVSQAAYADMRLQAAL